MLRTLTWGVLSSLALAATVAGPAAADPPEGSRGFVVTSSVHDDRGRVVWEFGHMGDDENLRFARHHTHRPHHGGGTDPGTDCESDAFRQLSYRWVAPYAAQATDFAAEFHAAGMTWDAATGSALFGGITTGSAGVAGQRDGINQIAFADLASSTIAVTTTWYFQGSGQAVESDGQYNSDFAWGTSGAANVMDVQNIATHELGHTFGLDHPKGKASQIGCLTMYAYGAYGETQKRTLGDGDILGIQAKYGA